MKWFLVLCFTVALLVLGWTGLTPISKDEYSDPDDYTGVIKQLLNRNLGKYDSENRDAKDNIQRAMDGSMSQVQLRPYILTKSQQEDMSMSGAGFFSAIGSAISAIFDAIWWLLVQIWELLKLLPWILILEITGIAIVVGAILFVIGLGVMYVWVKIRQGGNYDYNIFDDPNHSTAAKLSFASMRFSIPKEFKNKVKSVSASKQHKGEQLQFEQKKGEMISLILNTRIGRVATYKYFEVDVVENPSDCNIYIGIWMKKNFRDYELPQKGPNTVICNGSKGTVSAGNKKKKFDFRMKDFGDVGGIVLFNDPEGIDNNVEVVPTWNGSFADNLEEPDELKTQAGAILETEEEFKEKTKGMKKAEIKKLEKVKKEQDEKRKKERQKYKLFIENDASLYPFISCDGPCSFDVNLGSQIFHIHHDELNKGLLA